MVKTYRITRGNQYDGRAGYLAKLGKLYAWGKPTPVGLSCNGQFLIPAEIESAIMATLADGQERRITIGEAPAAAPVASEWTSPRGLTLAEEMDREDSAY